jgi:hypothetical protein
LVTRRRWLTTGSRRLDIQQRTSVAGRKRSGVTKAPGDDLRGPLGSLRLGTSASPTMLAPPSRHPIVCNMWQRLRHSGVFISARKARADNSRLLQSARRASSIARALRVCTSEINSSISRVRNPEYHLHFQGRRQRSSQQFEMVHSLHFGMSAPCPVRVIRDILPVCP